MHIRPNLFGRLFGAVKRIELKESELVIRSKSSYSAKSTSLVIRYSDLVDLPVIQRRIFGHSILVNSGSNSVSILFLGAREAKGALRILEGAAAENLASDISSAITLLKDKVEVEYFRDSSSEAIEATLKLILKRYSVGKGRWDVLLGERTVGKLRAFNALIPIAEGKKLLRQRFEKRMLEQRQGFYDDIESNPLTEQQRLSVIRNNDLNLVLAAAGTGKTSVMVAKAVDLIDSGRAMGKEILVLAFNNAAANELKESSNSRIETQYRRIKRADSFYLSRPRSKYSQRVWDPRAYVGDG